MNFYLVVKQTTKGLYLIYNGKSTFVEREHENYEQIYDLAKEYNQTKDVEERTALYDEIIALTVNEEISAFYLTDGFELGTNGQMYLEGIPEAIPEQLAKMINEGLKAGIDIEPYKKFWLNLTLNPEPGVRKQAFAFLEHNGHPITTNGYFLAYKAVNVKPKFDTKTGQKIAPDIYDAETGEKIINQDLVFTSITTGPYGGTIKIGEPVSMPRELCDPNPENHCSPSLHVGSMGYVRSFGGANAVILECLINPRNIVAVPSDHNCQKLRCCEYYPFAISNGENQNIYLESDYLNYDKEQLKEELKAYEKKKEEQIEQLEAELELRKKITGLL